MHWLIMRLLTLLTILLFTTACNNAVVGASCERKGDSFLTRHNCAHKCLAWKVTCGDGKQVAAPNICSGTQDCSLNNPCPNGQVCAVSGGNNYCVPLSLCPSGVPTKQPSSAEVLKKFKDRKTSQVPKK